MSIKDLVRELYGAQGYSVEFQDEIVVSDADIERVIKNASPCDYERAKKALQWSYNDLDEAIERVKQENDVRAYIAEENQLEK